MPNPGFKFKLGHLLTDLTCKHDYILKFCGGGYQTWISLGDVGQPTGVLFVRCPFFMGGTQLAKLLFDP